jgi:hypothetical protein
MQGNTQDYFQLDERVPGFELLIDEEIALVMFIYLISSELHILLDFPFICFLTFLFLPFRAIFCVIKPV